MNAMLEFIIKINFLSNVTATECFNKDIKQRF